MRLATGIPVPKFSIADLDGAPVTPETFAGQKLWLILARFVACPFCSVRLRDVIKRHDTLTSFGVQVFVVFPSAEHRVRQFARKYAPPFRVAADPRQTIFQLFGSETSWLGNLRTLVRVPRVISAVATTRMNPLDSDDVPHRMPSEFLVTPAGMIDEAFYAEMMDDGLAISRVVQWARRLDAEREERA
ncbi:MAG: redoxin domain-containing protein [Myxococcales bacterium]|nr:redoxin domain-containing protein [Myxococcales bacterium]MCB9755111.1 redoxin domain-containing protein [Myxococcales bacterium]